MWTTILAFILIFSGVTLLILSSIPMSNTLENKTLTINYIIGKQTIDITNACFLPIPDDVNKNIIRLCGASVGKKHSGYFYNYKTKVKYQFYLTGKGERYYFELDNKKYLVDDITPDLKGPDDPCDL